MGRTVKIVPFVAAFKYCRSCKFRFDLFGFITRICESCVMSWATRVRRLNKQKLIANITVITVQGNSMNTGRVIS